VTTTTDAVDVRYNSDAVITADVGGYWITWTRHSGSWECSCSEVGNRCAHVLSVQQTLGGQS
jgi:hypothetical protein